MLRQLRRDAYCPQTIRSSAPCGFTLYEMLIALAILFMVMAALQSGTTLYLRLQTENYEDVDRLAVARTLLHQVSRDVKSVVFREVSTTEEQTEEGSEGEQEVTTDTAVSNYTQGLLGTSQDLILFVSRPDRNATYVSPQQISDLQERTGDLAIIRYFLADPAAGGLAGEFADWESGGSSDGPVGLARMTGDYTVLNQAVLSGDSALQLQQCQMLAREVSGLQFRYYDGLDWQTEWDSTTSNAVPQAVEVTLTLRTAWDEDLPEAVTESTTALGETTHTMVIALPLALPATGDAGL